jgi:disulfide bond formation protein DsbB
MKVAQRMFLALCVFFGAMAVIYGMWNQWADLAGPTALALATLMMALASWYLWITERKFQDRPEEDAEAEIAQGAGEYGFFTPHSWWPLWCGLAGAIIFAGFAVGWWLFMIGAAIGVVALWGWAFEHYHGEYAN